MVAINRSSFWGKVALFLIAAGGGTGLFVQHQATQRDLDVQREATAGIERRLGDSELSHQAQIARERAAREELEKSSSAQARLLEQRLEQAEGLAGDAQAANRDLAQRLSEREQTAQDMQSTITELNRRLGTTIGMEQVMQIVDRAAPAAVNISYTNKDGDEVVLSGSILKANGKRYLLTVGHGHENVGHWINQELTIKMFNGLTFKMIPRPFADGSIPYLSSSGGDLAMSELPSDIDAQIPENVGLELRAASEPPRYGEPILVVGNPGGLNSAISIGFVRHPGRYVTLGGRLYGRQVQVTELDGGNSGGPVISLVDGKQIAISGWIRRGYMTHGFGANNVNIASLIDGTFRIPIMTPEDRHYVGVMNFAERFQMPTPLCPIPLGNFVPIANEPTQIANISVVDPMSRFLMPNPFNPFPLGNLAPKKK